MKYLDGSYTVEAAAIVSLSLLIIMSLLMLGFSVYGETVAKVTEYEMTEIDAPDVFRAVCAIKSIKDEKEE